MFLFLHRFATGKAFADLALDFDIDQDTAKNTYVDVAMYVIMHDPYVPTIWDDETATDEEIGGLLQAIKNRQSPAIMRIQNCFRTPDGRECVAVNYDTTHFPTPNSLDAHFQMDHYSGPRGKGHCELGGGITCPAGTVVAFTPGLKVSATPRGGDGVTLGAELGQSDQMPVRLGFTRLLKGTPTIGALLVWDRGFICIPHNVSRGCNPTPVDWCRDNDVQCIWAFKVGEKCFEYNEQTDILEEVTDNQDKTKANNR